MRTIFALLLVAGAAQAQVTEVPGEQCPPGQRHVRPEEARAEPGLCRRLGEWDIVRLAGGGSMDGPGYKCGVRDRDERPLGNALCRPAEFQPPPQPVQVQPPMNAPRMINEVRGEQCPQGSDPVGFDEANARRDEICPRMGQYDIARLAGGGSMDGPGYHCVVRAQDSRQLGNALCAMMPPPPQQPPPVVIEEGREHHHHRRIMLRADEGGFFSRCNNCQVTMQNRIPDTITIQQGEGAPWARFEVLELPGGQVALKGDNGKYVGRCTGCVVGSQRDFISVVTPGNQPPPEYARFTIERMPEGRVAIRADNGRYLGRCRNCSPGAAMPDVVAIDSVDPLRQRWAQWQLIEVE